MILISFIVLIATLPIFNSFSPKTKLEDALQIIVGILGIITIISGAIMYRKRRN